MREIENSEAEKQNHSPADFNMSDLLLAETPGVRANRAEDDGATMIEYVFIVSFVVLIAIAAVRFFGQQVSAQFSDIADSVRPVLGG